MSKPDDMPEMTYRRLGRSGLEVSAISIGGWLTHGGLVDKEGSFACIKAAYDCGVNFFDSAEGYSKGQAEVVLGEAIKKFGFKRGDIVVSTKIYWGQAYGDRRQNNCGLSRKHIIEGLNNSLKRLDLEYVDLVYAHRPDRTTPIEETVRAFNHVINTGKAFYWGTSEWTADEIAQAWRVADRLGLIGPLMEQPSYSMLSREKVEKEYAHLYREVGLGLTVYSPMKGGILSGKYKDGFPEGSRFSQNQLEYVKGHWKRTSKEDWDDMVTRTNNLKPIADKLGTKQGTLALAWVLKNPNVSTALTGASSAEQVYENCKAIALVDKLTPEIMEEIEKVLENKPPEWTTRF